MTHTNKNKRKAGRATVALLVFVLLATGNATRTLVRYHARHEAAVAMGAGR